MLSLTNLPLDLQQMVETIPGPAAIRERLAKHRAEGTLLRRLLRLAIDAERVYQPERNPASTESAH
jgi:hypothetical protein